MIVRSSFRIRIVRRYILETVSCRLLLGWQGWNLKLEKIGPNFSSCNANKVCLQKSSTNVISKNRDEFYLTIFVITLQEHFVYGSKHYVMTDQVRFLGR